ncbi:uncharacterized protein LOC131316169 [Rhododendron vialii]|uniref:uncharacterized protein LOC131316169 n=1 Tax=Rhododendron vialii TaxID=182163 RepID=UPI00265DE620|nr:uncharacterized protein LOC131316169 [Rhododendron vialii]
MVFVTVLGKAKDFLGVFSEANKRLEDNANNYDIEVLTGNESEYIEMDLMLGIADLHTPEALAAAESAIRGYQPVISLSTLSSSDDSSDDESTDDDTDDDDGGDGDHLPCSPTKTKRSIPRFYQSFQKRDTKKATKDC